MVSPSTSSGLLSADVAVSDTSGRLHALTVLTDGTNAATVVLYDNASAASGTVLAKVIVAGADRMAVFSPHDAGVVVNQGIFLDITGTGAEAIVHFTKG